MWPDTLHETTSLLYRLWYFERNENLDLGRDAMRGTVLFEARFEASEAL